MNHLAGRGGDYPREPFDVFNETWLTAEMGEGELYHAPPRPHPFPPAPPMTTRSTPIGSILRTRQGRSCLVLYGGSERDWWHPLWTGRGAVIASQWRRPERRHRRPITARLQTSRLPRSHQLHMARDCRGNNNKSYRRAASASTGPSNNNKRSGGSSEYPRRRDVLGRSWGGARPGG